MCVRERVCALTRVCVCVCVRESVCVCVCVCVRERERVLVPAAANVERWVMYSTW